MFTARASRHVTSWHGWPYLVKPWILRPMHFMWPCMNKWHRSPGSTRSTLLHERINPKDWQVLFVGDAGFLPFLGLFQVIMANLGAPWIFGKFQDGERPRFLEANEPRGKAGYSSILSIVGPRHQGLRNPNCSSCPHYWTFQKNEWFCSFIFYTTMM